MTTTAADRLRQLFDPATRPDPYPVFTALREAAPSMLFDGKLFLLGTYEDCRKVLLDPNASSERSRAAVPVTRPPRRQSFLSMDPPDHTRLRGLVSKAFTPRVVAGLTPKITQLVDDSLTAMAGATGAEIVSAFAYPLPVQIIGALLGVPPADYDRLQDWSRVFVRGLDPVVLSPVSDEEAARIDDVREEFAEYFERLIALRRDSPGQDLLSRLVRIEEQGDQLSGEELVAICVLLLVAGHETTANLIANAVLALLRNPAELAALRADPSRAAAVVEETLRYDPPVQLTGRFAKGPIHVGDLEIPAGSAVMVLLGAANRDPAAHTDPDRFDPGRDHINHLAFAAGPHFCLGAPLARLEATVALRAFAARVRQPVLDESSLRYRPHVNLRGPDRLMVSFAGID